MTAGRALMIASFVFAFGVDANPHDANVVQGQGYLTNPNGIVVGPDGRIDTNSFMASTIDYDDQAFKDCASLTFRGDSRTAILDLANTHTTAATTRTG